MFIKNAAGAGSSNPNYDQTEKIDHCGAVPRVFLTGCTASSGTRCARLYYGFLSCCSAYGAIDFLSAALDSDTVSRDPQVSDLDASSEQGGYLGLTSSTLFIIKKARNQQFWVKIKHPEIFVGGFSQKLIYFSKNMYFPLIPIDFQCYGEGIISILKLKFNRNQWKIHIFRKIN